MSATAALPDFAHQSVLVEQVLAHLPTRRGFVFADLTLGAGGHSRRILEARPDARLLVGIDRDPQALAASRANLASFAPRVKFFVSRFSGLPTVLSEIAEPRVDGVLADLGVSSPQLDVAERGFSFQRSGPLDMRMGDDGPTLETLLAEVDEAELTRWLFDYGEERHARRVARAILLARGETHTTTDLAKVVRAALPPERNRKKHQLDPATRTFQALRIAVNRELDELDALLELLPEVLNDEGVAMVISFHSLEDRAVKDAFREAARGCICPPKLPVCQCHHQPSLKVVTNKPLVANEAEVAANPRARSAKLRVAMRVARAA